MSSYLQNKKLWLYPVILSIFWLSMSTTVVLAQSADAGFNCSVSGMELTCQASTYDPNFVYTWDFLEDTGGDCVSDSLNTQTGQQASYTFSNTSSAKVCLEVYAMSDPDNNDQQTQTFTLSGVGGGGRDLGDFSGVSNPIASSSIQEFLRGIVDAIQTLLTPILVLALVYAGFLFVTAQGNTQKLQRAKKVLYWTVIGIVVVITAHLIESVITETVQEIRNNS